MLYPVGLLINWTSLPVARRLLSHSERKLRERADSIKAKLAEDGGWVMTPAEWAQYEQVSMLFKYLFGSVHTILTAILVLVFEYQKSAHTLTTDSYYFVVGGIIFLMADNAFVYFLNRRKRARVAWYHSAKFREVFQKQLDDIDETLAT